MDKHDHWFIRNGGRCVVCGAPYYPRGGAMANNIHREAQRAEARRIAENETLVGDGYDIPMLLERIADLERRLEAAERVVGAAKELNDYPNSNEVSAVELRLWRNLRAALAAAEKAGLGNS